MSELSEKMRKKYGKSRKRVGGRRVEVLPPGSQDVIALCEELEMFERLSSEEYLEKGREMFCKTWAENMASGKEA